MMRITTTAIFLSVLSYAQKTHTINGVIKDKDTGEFITGALIKVKENPNFNAETNTEGFYSLSLPENDYTLIISYKNHKDERKKIHLDEAIKLNLTLEKEGALIDEVIIKESKKEALTKSKIGAEILDIESISKLPVLFGETDIIKTLQFLPGITSSEGSSNFSVRGGTPDQNLILLDDAPVFNNAHMAGVFSTFNSDALKSVTLYKGNMPSPFGGRLSSVIDVKTKDGDNQKYNVSGGIGLISSRLSVDGPIQKGKSSFIISGRRTYADLLYKSDDGIDKLYFYDFNAKANYQINKNNNIFLSAYLGRDIFSFNDIKSTWGNIVSTLRWNSILSNKLLSNTSITFSNYDFKATIQNLNGEPLEVNPNIRNFGIKQNFTHQVGEKHTFNYGVQSSYYYFNTPKLPENITSGFLKDPRSMWENAVYINDDFKVNDKFFINSGVRLSMVHSENKVDNNPAKSNLNIEPRLMFNYEFANNNFIRAGYTRNSQNIQTLAFANAGAITDIFLNLKKSEIANQVSLGYIKKLGGEYEFNAEVFYKKMSNLVDYKDGTQVNILEDIGSNLLYNGQGRAYGLEILAKKNKGKLTGWISYTLSKGEKKNDDINNGKWYNTPLDKTHNLAIVASYQLSTNWSLAGAFALSTGIAQTYPTGKYEIDGQTYLQYGDRNSNRTPLYHRLDLNATYERKTNKRFKGSWTFGFYNIYMKNNPLFIYFEEDKNVSEKINTVKPSFFKIIPSITYNFKF